MFTHLIIIVVIATNDDDDDDNGKNIFYKNIYISYYKNISLCSKLPEI